MINESKINRAVSALTASSEITAEEVRQKFLDSGESEEDAYLAIKAAEVSLRMNENDWFLPSSNGCKPAHRANGGKTKSET